MVKIDSESNTVFVGHREQTLVERARLLDTNFLTEADCSPGAVFQVKVRSTAAAVAAKVETIEDAGMVVIFEKPQSGVAPGQASVLYSDERVVGGGWIEEAW